MLEKLIISNIALISHLEVDLKNGLIVLTGETGAGKSIIIDSVNLVLGERANRDLIAANKSKAKVEAFFSIADNSSLKTILDEMQLEYEDEVVLMREITTAGKSLCRVNGEVVSLASLKRIADTLVDVHGQHAHQSLLDPKKHMSMIDEFGGDEIKKACDRMQTLYKKRTEIERKLNSNFVSPQERERRIDVLSYQINEIEKAELRIGEEEEITSELSMLSNAERIKEALQMSAQFLLGEQSAVDAVNSASAVLSKITDFSSAYSDIHERLQTLYYELQDASLQLSDMNENFEFSEGRLNELETRLDYINSLKRKYGGSIETILNFQLDCENELNKLIGSEQNRQELSAELEKIDKEYWTVSNDVSDLRKNYAHLLCESVTQQLHELSMVNARFDYVNEKTSDKPHPNGNDSIEFVFSANAGEPMRSLAKIASGGEISRIMLGIKTVCAAQDSIPTLIFDEIDSGISGITATKVGEKMNRIAKSHQVLCITHLAQIAAFADAHMLVEKFTVDGETHSSLRLLSDDERTVELARIIGSADADESAVNFAKNLIAASRKIK